MLPLIFLCTAMLPVKYSQRVSIKEHLILLLSSKELFFSFRCKLTAESSPEEVSPAVLCHSFMERLFCLPTEHICAVLAALNSINDITLFIPGCFVLRMDKPLPHCAGRFKVNRDMVFIIDFPEFLRFPWHRIPTDTPTQSLKACQLPSSYLEPRKALRGKMASRN